MIIDTNGINLRVSLDTKRALLDFFLARIVHPYLDF